LEIHIIVILGAIQPKGLNRIAKISLGHMFLRKENLSFIAVVELVIKLII
jgi:hypothetical protein